MDTDARIDSIFDLLDRWRNLPAYQLERRADIFFALYIPKIIRKRFGMEVSCLIPEFPVRVGHVYPESRLTHPNRSFKIDYVAVAEASGTVFLIELKTDSLSHRESQKKYLERAKKINVPGLVEGVLEICRATASKKKYANLVALLAPAGWVDAGTCTNIAPPYKVEVVYIQPDGAGDGNIIPFRAIAEYLKDETDAVTRRFVESLKTWETNPNG